MDAQTTKTHDLGNDWYLNIHSNGSATLRNPEKGQRIDLPASSVSLLREICREVAAA